MGRANNLDVHFSEYTDSVMLGMHPTAMEDSETLGEFKKRVIVAINTILPKSMHINKCTYMGETD